MPSENTILLAIELSASAWLVAYRLPKAEKCRLQRIAGGDTPALLALISGLRSRVTAELGSADVACCFEAGRDGVWLHRVLTAQGVAAYVLEPTSVLVNRRARRAKTDRLDAEGMVRVLASWLSGDRKICSMLRVPTPEQEDAKRRHREREHLVHDRVRIENRIEALLFTQGIRKRPSLRSWSRDLDALRTGDGRVLPPLLRAELDRLRRRLALVLELIRELEAEREATLSAAARPIDRIDRSRPSSKSGASAPTSPPCWYTRCSTAASRTAVSSPAMSALHRRRTRAAPWIETGASAGPATRGLARP